jgi:hypothetical protein
VRFVGTGDSELTMMRTVEESGWRGPVGIINEHTDLDAADALTRNLAGIAWVQKELRQPGSGGPKPTEPAPPAAAKP